MDGVTDLTMLRGIRTSPLGPVTRTTASFDCDLMTPDNRSVVGVDVEDLVAGNEAGAREYDRFEQIVSGADRADACEIRTDLAAFRADGVATGAGDLFAEEQASSAADVAAGGQQRFEFLEPLDALLLRFLKLLEERLGRLLHVRSG